ncbi:protein FAM193B isoform X2 [Phycodurus eques]|uniref:protein FAM193B isoform X2 n=1 Tax=Phycodurus eques TaxID=693459 RepID=UPI002ACDC37E|nr:protein FAM193B isoform X2 [Phycodurus eques]
MARKKSKQQGVAQKELVPGQQTVPKYPVSPGDATGGGGGDAGVESLATTRANQPMHTCCLLCHREFKDWGANSVNGLLRGHGTKLADGVPALSQALSWEAPVGKVAQSLLGELPLWICQSCCKSVEEEERRSAQEQPTGVPLSHSSSCKSQGCGNGYPEQSTVDWDPSSFLSAHKLSGLWNSTHTNGGEHWNHNAPLHIQQGITTASVCHEKRGLHEAPGKSAKTSVAKVCPYSHPLTQNSSGSSAGTPLSSSADLCKTTPKHFKNMCRRPTPPDTIAMARKKSKQQGVAQKELVPGQQTVPKNPVSPGDATGGGGGDAGVESLATTRANQPMHTCCLLCHREFKDWGANSVNGLPRGHGTKLADAVPALSQALSWEAPAGKLAQSLLGELPLWICQSCCKSVEEEERRSAQEQPTGVPLSHSSSCKFQGCGNGYPEQSTVDWDPSSFLSAHKLSGLWNSAHTNGGEHCNHNASLHIEQGITTASVCHEKRGLHEAPGKSAKTSVAKVCPYSHPLTQNSSGSSAGTPLSTSADLCKTTPKHFKNVCRRPTPPGEAFHASDHHQHTDLSVPPNSPTGLSSQHSSLLPPKPSSGQYNHVTSSSATGVAGHTPFTPLVPNLHGPTAKRASPSPDSPTLVHKPSPCKNSHIPAVNTQHGKLGPSVAGCNHPCNAHSTGTVASTNVGSLSSGACRDQACKGHKMTNGTMCETIELEEVEDEDSSSERSSCASSSTNQKDGKYCDCCYCEFFGHNAPPAAPTSRNYTEIREKLRSRLTRRKEELPQRQDSELTGSGAIDNRDVDELLDFINSSQPKPVNSAKAAKRARHKQKKKEKALQGNVSAASSDPLSNPSECIDEPTPDTAETSRLLDWPQLELERVNSFLTSRLEEIKNTIKDSIRASFSMYDLNLDVNDFPKKAATLEGNHLLSHLNSSSDLQQIDLDLAPLSLGTFKNHLDLVNGWEDTNASPNTTTATGITGVSKDVQRLNTTPSVSKLTRVHSPEKCTSSGSDSLPHVPAQVTAKSKEDISDSKNSTVGNGSTKSKKSKKQQQQKQEQSFSEHNSKVTESRVAEIICNGSKASLKQLQQAADTQKNGLKKAEESRSSRNAAANGANIALSNAHKVKGDTEMRTRRCEQDSESKAHPAIPANGQHPTQSKGKNKKNKNKDDVFLPKDVDPTQMDEIDREVEYFKRFCLDSAKQTRQKVAVNWSNFSLKKVPSNAAQ